MLDLYVLLCDHKDCKEAMFGLSRSEEQALAARDKHNATGSYDEEPHDAYLVTIVARKYAR